MYIYIYLSSSLLIMSVVTFIIIKKKCKKNECTPTPLKKTPSPKIRREHINLDIPDDFKLNNENNP